MSLPRTCFISAGERSGDLLAADLVRSLNASDCGLKFEGIAGSLMAEEGVRVLWPLEALSVMGLVDVLRQAPALRMLERRVLSHIDSSPPGLAILVDYPGLHFRLAEQFKLRGIPVVQYVAPKVWAWGGSRVHRLRRDFDLVLGILPFEGFFFRKHQVNWHYTGCPHVSRIDAVRVDRRELGLPGNAPVLACLPGSRMTEVSRILPVIPRIRDLIIPIYPDLEVVIPVAANLPYEEVCQLLPAGQRDNVRFIRGNSIALMKQADAAVVASGTATLECALAGTPMVVVYLMDEFSYRLAKFKVRLSWVSLVNLCLEKEVVPEFIQKLPYDEIAGLVALLLDQGSDLRQKQLASFRELRSRLGPSPGARKAASLILSYLLTPGDPDVSGGQLP